MPKIRRMLDNFSIDEEDFKEANENNGYVSPKRAKYIMRDSSRAKLSEHSPMKTATLSHLASDLKMFNSKVGPWNLKGSL